MILRPALRTVRRASSPIRHVHNFNPGDGSNMAVWRAAKDRVRTGAGRGEVLCPGDSNTLGQGCGSGVDGIIGAYALAWPAKMAEAMAAAGLPTIHTARRSGYSAGNYGINTAVKLNSYDPRVIIGTGWVPDYSTPANTLLTSTVGGPMWFNNSSTTGVLGYTVPAGHDRVVVHYNTNTPLGVASWAINAGAATNFSQAGAAQLIELVLTVSPGDVVNLRRVSGTVYFSGFTSYSSTVSAIDVQNVGYGGANSVTWAQSANAWQTGPAVTFAAADLVIDRTRSNDDGSTAIGTTALSTFGNNKQDMIDRARAGGGNIILSTASACGGTATHAVQLTYADKIIEVGNANKVVVVDDCRMFGDYTQLLANGDMWDTVHTNENFATKFGRFMGRLLIAA